MNSVVLIGRLTRDPEVRYISANSQMADRDFYRCNRQTDQDPDGKKKTDFPRVNGIWPSG